jgi:homoserine O-succinyltransferase
MTGVEPEHATGAGEAERQVVIGLVNNMPDAAFRTTERQFRELLSAAPLGHRIQVRRFYLPDVPRSSEMQSYLGRHYESVADLWTSHVDGLIVTGAEPRAPVLTEEPFWGDLARLIDWAADHTVSTVWSCLAAHAAVLKLDGIARRPLPGKLSGVFDCQKIIDHPLLAGMPAQWRIPHSRYNGLPEALLEASGYLLLSRSVEAGADLFIKQGASLFIFLHGRPEYAPDALLREYRRDITRFLSGERDDFPEAPGFYFDGETTTALSAFRQRALEQRTLDLLVELPAKIADDVLMHPWKDPARDIFANWLTYLVQKSQVGDLSLSTSPQHLASVLDCLITEVGITDSGADQTSGDDLPYQAQPRVDFAPGL